MKKIPVPVRMIIYLGDYTINLLTSDFTYYPWQFRYWYCNGSQGDTFVMDCYA
jgi:hypothetical protein